MKLLIGKELEDNRVRYIAVETATLDSIEFLKGDAYQIEAQVDALIDGGDILEIREAIETLERVEPHIAPRICESELDFWGLEAAVHYAIFSVTVPGEPALWTFGHNTNEALEMPPKTWDISLF